MPFSLLHEAREQVLWFGAIGPYVAARLEAIGYDVSALERRLLDQINTTHDDLRSAP
jgi:hypothetical protein